ncbi:MAG: NAD(P)/FAD-dependent oxidoreductase [Bacteroidota bacterium]
MKSTYDLIVIGGGPAGSTMATLMSRRGYQVLVLEKEQFPRPHVGESMLSKSYYLFEDLGVLEEMTKRYARKPGIVFSNTDGSHLTEWDFSKIIENDSSLSFNVNRADFDQLLLENSRTAGAEVWEKAQVTAVDLAYTEDQVLVSGFREGTVSFEVKGKFLIDASGQGSFMGTRLKSKQPLAKESNRLAISSHWVEVDYDTELAKGNLKIVHLDIEGGGWMWMIPVEENKIGIGTVMSSWYFRKRRRAAQGDWIEDFYRELVFSSSVAQKVLAKAERSAPVSLSSDYSYRNTQKYGPRFATVGDASAFIDPIFSSGVYIALKSSYLVAEALDEQFRNGRQDLLPKVYERIDGALEVVEQLVNNYYHPDAIRINEMEELRQSTYEQQRTAMQTFYLLLSGEFFDVPKRYLDTIYLLRDKKKLAQYERFIKGKKSKEKMGSLKNS